MNAIPSLHHAGFFGAISTWLPGVGLCLIWPAISPGMLGYAFAGAQLAILLCGALYLARMQQQASDLRSAYAEEAIRQARLAHLERERCRILEAVSSALPLEDLYLLLVNLLSREMNEAHCWFLPARAPAIPSAGIPDAVSPNLDAPHIRREARSERGEWLGVFVVEPPPSTTTTTAEYEPVLEMVGTLAVLAIENRRSHEDLVRRSEHDALTGLPNRALLEQRAAQAMAAAQRYNHGFALIYVDLDHFKKINDRYGHRVGDLYLQAVSLRLSERLRRRDTLARVGGDEFLAVINQVAHRSEVAEVVQRFADCFATPFHIHELVLMGSASFGIAVYPEDGCTIQELQCAADSAMYAKKHAAIRGQEADHSGVPTSILQQPVPSSISTGTLDA